MKMSMQVISSNPKYTRVAVFIDGENAGKLVLDTEKKESRVIDEVFSSIKSTQFRWGGVKERDG